jgi:adenine/guanine/hypoxanthine permease
VATQPQPVDRRREVLAGLTTFMTMSYILVVNPMILGAAGLEFDLVLTATVLSAAIGSILMGLVARLPYAVAPGMGLNAFFAFELVLGRGVPPRVALGLVAWSGIVFCVLSLTPLRRQVARAIPAHLRAAVAAGLGIFLAFIGLRNAGLVAGDPATLLTRGALDHRAVYMVLGLLVAAALHRRKQPYAFLAAIVGVTIAGAIAGHGSPLPASLVSMPSFKAFVDSQHRVDLVGALQVTLIPPLLTLFFTDLFDSLSTFVGVAQSSGLVDEHGEPLRMDRALAVDAAATLTSGLVGSSPATTYIESTAGIEAGGRTGLTAVVAGLAFLPFLFLGPVAALVPAYATAPVLVLVGALMARNLTALAEGELEDRLPAFVVVITIPLTHSITNGLLFGFVLHPTLYLLTGRQREVSGPMWALMTIALGLLAMDHLGAN